MTKAAARRPSPRREEVLERAYRSVLERGISGISLRPLAKAVGSSPRVLLFLFGSKDGLIRALLERARRDELELLDQVPVGEQVGLAAAVALIWSWLSAPEHRALLRLWTEAYARSLVEPGGPWAEFAKATVEDWLAVLATAQPARVRRSRAASAERTLALSVLRGAMLDLLATGDQKRTTAAVERHLADLRSESLQRQTAG
jgi:AcrR family transcriptional regulator